MVMVLLDYRDVVRLGWEINYAQLLLRNNDCWQRTSFALLSVVVLLLQQRHRLRYTLVLFLRILWRTYAGHLMRQLLLLEGQVSSNMFVLELFLHQMLS